LESSLSEAVAKQSYKVGNGCNARSARRRRRRLLDAESRSSSSCTASSMRFCALGNIAKSSELRQAAHSSPGVAWGAVGSFLAVSQAAEAALAGKILDVSSREFAGMDWSDELTALAIDAIDESLSDVLVTATLEQLVSLFDALVLGY
jgi:hypothetical protein